MKLVYYCIIHIVSWRNTSKVESNSPSSQPTRAHPSSSKIHQLSLTASISGTSMFASTGMDLRGFEGARPLTLCIEISIYVSTNTSANKASLYPNQNHQSKIGVICWKNSSGANLRRFCNHQIHQVVWWPARDMLRMLLGCPMSLV